MSQLDLHVAWKSYLKGGLSSEARFGKGSEGSCAVWFSSSCGQVAALCPSEFTPAQRIVCPKTGADLFHHCWADVIINTRRRQGCFPETAVQFRESTTWQPDGEPTVTMISKFKNPLQFKYFMLKISLCSQYVQDSGPHAHSLLKQMGIPFLRMLFRVCLVWN